MQTRYPGLSSFTTAQKDIFFGRKQETRDLSNLLSVERTVVLFSKSGYGKTSLLQAGVMPLLYSRQIVPVPVRFGTDALSPEQHFSIQFDTAWLKFLGKTEQQAQKQARDTSPKETFWEQIRRCPFGEGKQQFTPLLIFDQFEELFTLYPDKEKRTRFVAELADLVQERLPESLGQDLYERLERGEMTTTEVAAWETPPPMKFIFSIRSDMLHFMDELSEPMPYILRSRYQLFGLGEEQAREAIVAPAALGYQLSESLKLSESSSPRFASQPFGYEEESLREILSVLSKNKEVESFQLQAVCQAIEEKVIRLAATPSGKVALTPPLGRQGEWLLIAPDFYGGREGIDRILEDSYNRRLEDLASIDETWPDKAHRLLEDRLVNENDRRQSVDVVSLLRMPGVTQKLLDELEAQRLVRKEPRLDSFYYEISHDTWLGPILKNRKAWQEAEERRLLEAKAEAERVEKEKAIAARRRARLIALFGFLLAGLAVGAAWFAILKSSEAERQTAEAVLQTIKADSLLVEAQDSKRLAEEKIILASEKAAEAERQSTIAQSALRKADESLVLAKREEEKARLALIQVESEKSATEAQRQEALKNLQLAQEQTARAEAEKKNAEVQLLASRLMAAHKFPDNFDALISLDTLDCSGWGLGSLPSEIGKLQNLQSLDLGNNRLNSLPAEIWNLQNLRSLCLIQNPLTSLPAKIGNLQNLQSLNLYSNQLTSLPSEIGNLQNLKWLELGGNSLTSLPAEIGNLQNLQSLNLYSNQLTSLPSEIGNLQNLQSLDLEDNKLTSLPAEIWNLQNLQSLGLQYTRLTSLPAEIGKLQNLQSLDLKYNQLTSLPTEIGKLQNLQVLELWGNQLTSLPIEALKKIKNLKALILKDSDGSNPLPISEVEALRAAMPWCEVRWEE